MLGRLGKSEQAIEGGNEIVGHGAAQTAVRKLDDTILRATLDAATFEDLAVDADIAELVDDDGQPPPAGILQDMADECCFPGSEKAGDDGAGRLGEARPGRAQGDGAR